MQLKLVLKAVSKLKKGKTLCSINKSAMLLLAYKNSLSSKYIFFTSVDCFSYVLLMMNENKSSYYIGGRKLKISGLFFV
jgi:hypothetical protein